MLTALSEGLAYSYKLKTESQEHNIKTKALEFYNMHMACAMQCSYISLIPMVQFNCAQCKTSFVFSAGMCGGSAQRDLVTIYCILH